MEPVTLTSEQRELLAMDPAQATARRSAGRDRAAPEGCSRLACLGWVQWARDSDGAPARLADHGDDSARVARATGAKGP